jgi:protein-S-isoprenylcysteine O-methyltransferase Ste14
MHIRVDSAIVYPWGAVGLVWLVGAAFTKRTVRSQPVGTRLFQLALAALGFMLLSPGWITTGGLAMRFVPPKDSFALAGLALTVAGCAFAIWARITLGANWSGRATVKSGHELVTRGPYALARHPIYSGLLLALAGTVLAIGAWRSVVGFLVILLLLMTKMSQEERLMAEAFPAEYPAYRQRVRALIPGVL